MGLYTLVFEFMIKRILSYTEFHWLEQKENSSLSLIYWHQNTCCINKI